MTIRMNNLEGLTLDEMEEWVASSRHIGYAAPGQRGHLRVHREDSDGAAVLPSEQRGKLDLDPRPVVLH